MAKYTTSIKKVDIIKNILSDIYEMEPHQAENAAYEIIQALGSEGISGISDIDKVVAKESFNAKLENILHLEPFNLDDEKAKNGANAIMNLIVSYRENR